MFYFKNILPTLMCSLLIGAQQAESAAGNPYKSFRIESGQYYTPADNRPVFPKRFSTSHKFELSPKLEDVKIVPLFNLKLHSILEHCSTPRLVDEDRQLTEGAQTGIENFARSCAQSPYVIHLSDLHGASALYPGILRYVCLARKANSNFCVVISGDLETRTSPQYKTHPWMRLDSKRIQDFLEVLRLLCGGRLYMTLGNHDVEWVDGLRAFTEFAHNRGFDLLVGAKDFFKKRLRRGMKDRTIYGNTLVFPSCTNYANNGVNPNLDGIFKNDIAIHAWKNLNRDGDSREGEPESLRFDYGSTCISERPDSIPPGEEEGQINPMVSDMWRSFKDSVEELATRNPGTGPLFVVFAAHEYYLRVYAFWEQVSRLFWEDNGISPDILNRLHVIVAGGHEHRVYAVEKPMVMTADDGTEVMIPGRAGAPGIYAQAMGLYAIKTANGQPAIPFNTSLDFNVAKANLKSINALPYLDDDQKLLLKVACDLAPLEIYETAATRVQENFPVPPARLPLPPFLSQETRDRLATDPSVLPIAPPDPEPEPEPAPPAVPPADGAANQFLNGAGNGEAAPPAAPPGVPPAAPPAPEPVPEPEPEPEAAPLADNALQAGAGANGGFFHGTLDFVQNHKAITLVACACLVAAVYVGIRALNKKPVLSWPLWGGG